MGTISEITDTEFQQFQALIFKIAGIHIDSGKKALVVGRLGRRLAHFGLGTFAQYYQLLKKGEPPEEHQVMVDLLTTNETSFFRESKHFEFLQKEVLPRRSRASTFRIWSAACSSGEEPYTLAMVLAESMGTTPWEIQASDISLTVLEKAQRAQYHLDRATGIPLDLLRKYCLKGVRDQDGTFIISNRLREHIGFRQINLNLPLPEIGQFHVIFLRNILIYFDMETKRRIVASLLTKLMPGGYFFIGHSESLNGICDTVTNIRPTVYQKP
ncbi:MAG: protein-glutamate O-methyltransferase CheR [Pseudomonadota bacterium]